MALRVLARKLRFPAASVLQRASTSVVSPPASSRPLTSHSSQAARCTGRSRNGLASSITNRKDLVHEQNVKILKLQNELEITKADMEVLKADIKLEVAKGQTKMLKYCIFVVGAGLLVETFASWPAYSRFQKIPELLGLHL